DSHVSSAIGLYDTKHGKNAFSNNLTREKNNFLTQLSHANSPEQVQQIVKAYGAASDHLPSYESIMGKSKSGTSLPPVGALPPKDAAKKYINLGKIKIPGA